MLPKYLLNKYPNENLNWAAISSNPNITISFIKKYFKKILPYFNNLLRNNLNINIKFIEMFEKYIITTSTLQKCLPEKKNIWKQNWESLSANPNITFEIVKHFSNEPWEYGYILKNINITYDMLPFFEKKLDKTSLYHWLLKNKHNLSLNIIEKYIDDDFFIYQLCYHNIPFEILKKYPNKNWDWLNISKHTDFTLEMLEYFSNKQLDWTAISCYTKIPLNIIKYNLNKPWDLYGLSLNIPFTFNFIKIIPKTSIRWSRISELSNITLEFFEKYYESWSYHDDNSGDIGLNIDCLSENPNISLEIIKKYNYLEWDWYVLSKNRAITLDFIENHIDFQ